jgi:hypothetical protein
MTEYRGVFPNAALMGVINERLDRCHAAYLDRALDLDQWPVPITHACVLYQKSGLISITLENASLGWIASFVWDFIFDRPEVGFWLPVWEAPDLLYGEVPSPLSLSVMREAL